MIQAYADESGADGRGPVFVFSALICDAELWVHFSDRWDSCLKEEPRIRYFKMDEAEGLSNEFFGFSDTERDIKVRKLCHVLSSYNPIEFHFISDLPMVKKYWGAKSGRPLTEPYFFPFHMVQVGIAHQVLMMGETQPYEMFFDEQVIFGPRAKAWYPVIKAMQDVIVQAVMPVEPFFRKDSDVLPLQAADLTAWVRRKLHNDGLGDFQWVLDELSGVVPSPLSQIFDEPLMKSFQTINYGKEYLDKKRAAMEAYEITFGHPFPPKDKKEMNRIRGRK